MDERLALNLREKVMGGRVYPQVSEQQELLARVMARLQSGEDLADRELEELNAAISRGEALNARVRVLVNEALRQ